MCSNIKSITYSANWNWDGKLKSKRKNRERHALVTIWTTTQFEKRNWKTITNSRSRHKSKISISDESNISRCYFSYDFVVVMRCCLIIHCMWPNGFHFYFDCKLQRTCPLQQLYESSIANKQGNALVNRLLSSIEIWSHSNVKFLFFFLISSSIWLII